MKNAPITAEHTMVAAGLLMSIRRVRESSTEAAWSASIEPMAQALANLGARLQHEAWQKGLIFGFSASGHGLLEDYLGDNPYPKLDDS
jgi:hypothetical protein